MQYKTTLCGIIIGKIQTNENKFKNQPKTMIVLINGCGTAPGNLSANIWFTYRQYNEYNLS